MMAVPTSAIPGKPHGGKYFALSVREHAWALVHQTSNQREPNVASAFLESLTLVGVFRESSGCSG